MTLRVVPLAVSHRQRAAELLVEGFREHWPNAWPTLDAALKEFDDVLDVGPALAATDNEGRLLGWIGARPSYGGHVWEIHPVVIDERYRQRGIGTALVAALEGLAAESDVNTLFLGSDDEDDMTSLGGVDLYPEPLRHLREIEDRKGHPFVFYRSYGFVPVGVIPDANGFGRPDILMAKRVTSTAERSDSLTA